MTDNEIIEDLENALEFSDELQFETIKDVIDLITRQNAEIERLTKTISDREYSCGELTAALQIANELLKPKKSEAIKEFSERLKESKIKPEYPWDDYYINEGAIDNLVNEMTGGE